MTQKGDWLVLQGTRVPGVRHMDESEQIRRTQPYLLLIVDDDPMIRLVARQTLESVGFEIVEAECGEDGIEAFGRLRPDLVLLDVDMPDLDGFEVCSAIRSILSNLEDTSPSRSLRATCSSTIPAKAFQ